MYELIF